MNNLKKVMISINEEMKEEIDRNNYDWFLDMMDINYIIDSYGKYKGVRLTLFLGGPNIFLDTINCELVGSWGGEEYSIPLDYKITEFVDNMYEQQFMSSIRV